MPPAGSQIIIFITTYKRVTHHISHIKANTFQQKWSVCSIHAMKEIQALSCICLTATLWTVARQAPLSMGLSRKEYWSGLLFPSPRGLPDPGTEPVSPALADGFFTTEPPGKPMHTTSKPKYPHKAKTKERLCRKMGEPNFHVFTPWPLLRLCSLQMSQIGCFRFIMYFIFSISHFLCLFLLSLSTVHFGNCILACLH